MVAAETGIEELKDKVDTLIVIPNQRLMDVIDKKMTLLDAIHVLRVCLIFACIRVHSNHRCVVRRGWHSNCHIRAHRKDCDAKGLDHPQGTRLPPQGTQAQA